MSTHLHVAKDQATAILRLHYSKSKTEAPRNIYNILKIYFDYETQQISNFIKCETG
jgi:hypothetical protein